MSSTIIFHIDVNSAFLSWSAVKRLKEDPSSVDLRTIPSAVGGDTKMRRGVITARSIPAKSYGVKTGEPVVTARQKCPSLVMVSSDFATYRQYSKAFLAILREYTDLVEQASIDEAYMDATDLVSGKDAPRAAAVELAGEIRRQIFTRLGFTVNVGISENKLLAKMASDFEKPDRTHTLWPEEIEEKMWPLPVRDLYGCGEKTAQKLMMRGIATIGQAAKTDLPELQKLLGEKAGLYIHRAANGIGSREVDTSEREAKSYSNETTTPFDITKENYDRELPEIVKGLSAKVSERLKKDGVAGKTVSVSVKTNDFRRHLRQTTCASPTDSAERIFQIALRLLGELSFGSGDGEGLLEDGGSGYRLVGVGVANLDRPKEEPQISMEEFLREKASEEKRERELETKRKKRESISAAMSSINKKYGENTVHLGGEKKK